MKISEIKINPNNPRIIKDDKFKTLVNSIRDFPKMMKLRPIVIDNDNIVLGGNMRLKALQELKYKEIPDEWVKRADELTVEEKKRFIIADNVGFGEWDFELLANEWDEKDLSEWGVDLPEFNNDIGISEAVEDNFEIPAEIQTDIVLGDLFEIGEHRLLCGDSTDSDSVAKLMNGEKADMVFTSPPYNISAGMYETYKDNLVSEEYIQFNINVIKNIKKVLRGILFWNISYNKNSRWEFLEIANQIRKDGFEFLELIVWNKKTAMPVVSKKMLTRQYEDIFVYADDETYNDIEMYEVLTNQKTVSFYKKTAKVFTNYWELTSQNSQLQNHKACFPVGLPGKAITLTTLSNDLLYEPFLGSGSTMVAAHQLKRKCYGMELDPKYCQVIVDRMRKLDPTLIIKKNGLII